MYFSSLISLLHSTCNSPCLMRPFITDRKCLCNQFPGNLPLHEVRMSDLEVIPWGHDIVYILCITPVSTDTARQQTPLFGIRKVISGVCIGHCYYLATGSCPISTHHPFPSNILGINPKKNQIVFLKKLRRVYAQIVPATSWSKIYCLRICYLRI